MVRLECQQCGAALHWDGTGSVIKCSYCGAEYLMHPQTGRFGRNPADMHTGTGGVQGIPIEQGEDFEGMCPIESYVPAGWRAGCRRASEEFYGDHSGNPYVVEAEYSSPDGSALVLFRGGNLYTDMKLSRVPLLHGIDVLGTYMRIGSPFGAEDYCDYILQRDVAPASAKKVRVEEADQAELARQSRIAANYESQGFFDLAGEWKRVTYDAVGGDGKRRLVSVETRVMEAYKALPQMGGGFFGGFFGQMYPSAQHFWETQYEFVVIAFAEKFRSVLPEAQRINETLQNTEDHEKIKAEFLQYLRSLQMQTASNIQQQDMASWRRMQNTVTSTHSQIMDTMHGMQASTSATHDRVARMHSESIRGVNSYRTASPGYGVPEVVEADVRWDRVFQNMGAPDIFAATETYWLEPGVDFEELKRTDGGE